MVIPTSKTSYAGSSRSRHRRARVWVIDTKQDIWISFGRWGALGHTIRAMSPVQASSDDQPLDKTFSMSTAGTARSLGEILTPRAEIVVLVSAATRSRRRSVSPEGDRGMIVLGMEWPCTARLRLSRAR